jgi:hypothetical protein
VPNKAVSYVFNIVYTLGSQLSPMLAQHASPTVSPALGSFTVCQGFQLDTVKQCMRSLPSLTCSLSWVLDAAVELAFAERSSLWMQLLCKVWLREQLFECIRGFLLSSRACLQPVDIQGSAAAVHVRMLHWHLRCVVVFVYKYTRSCFARCSAALGTEH